LLEPEQDSVLVQQLEQPALGFQQEQELRPEQEFQQVLDSVLE
jgi:hypothetical protein